MLICIWFQFVVIISMCIEWNVPVNLHFRIIVLHKYACFHLRHFKSMEKSLWNRNRYGPFGLIHYYLRNYSVSDHLCNNHSIITTCAWEISLWLIGIANLFHFIFFFLRPLEFRCCGIVLFPEMAGISLSESSREADIPAHVTRKVEKQLKLQVQHGYLAAVFIYNRV